jgi:uncharacterized protein (TIGR02118 family)
MSSADFAAHWMGPHAAIAKQLPGLRGLRFGIVRAWSPPDAAWDGIGELWFDSIDDAVSAFASEPCRSLLIEDRKQCFSETQSCFVEEHTVLPPPRLE